MASLRDLLRELRHGPDRLLHARRRAGAERDLAALAPPGGILFVCYGNICRSPYAEHRLRHHSAGRGGARDVGSADGRGGPVIASAGFYGPGRGSPPELVELALARGVDLRGHRSQLVTPGLLAGYGLVVTMEPRQLEQVRPLAGPATLVLALGDLDPGPIETRAIPDPWGQPRDVYGRVLDRLDRSVDALARALGLA